MMEGSGMASFRISLTLSSSTAHGMMFICTSSSCGESGDLTKRMIHHLQCMYNNESSSPLSSPHLLFDFIPSSCQSAPLWNQPTPPPTQFITRGYRNIVYNTNPSATATTSYNDIFYWNIPQLCIGGTAWPFLPFSWQAPRTWRLIFASKVIGLFASVQNWRICSPLWDTQPSSMHSQSTDMFPHTPPSEWDPGERCRMSTLLITTQPLLLPSFTFAHFGCHFLCLNRDHRSQW